MNWTNFRCKVTTKIIKRTTTTWIKFLPKRNNVKIFTNWMSNGIINLFYSANQSIIMEWNKVIVYMVQFTRPKYDICEIHIYSPFWIFSTFDENFMTKSKSWKYRRCDYNNAGMKWMNNERGVAKILIWIFQLVKHE